MVAVLDLFNFDKSEILSEKQKKKLFGGMRWTLGFSRVFVHFQFHDQG